MNLKNSKIILGNYFFSKIGVYVAIFLIVFLSSQNSYAQKSIWVGETYTCDASSAVMGLTSDVSWNTSGGYLSLSGSGFYRNVKVTQYFSGSATITCSWKYRLYSGDTWKTQKKSWTIRCNENPVSIYPSSMNLPVGEISSVGYSYKYNNSYTSYGNAYFASSNNRVATVSNSGVVTAISEGTAYINVYSKISDPSNAPYCIVTVKNVEPTGVSLPSSYTLTVGTEGVLTPTVTPSGAKTSFEWRSDNYDIAYVDNQGLVQGINVGKTKIWVTTTVGGYTAYTNVTVKEPPVAPTKIALKKSMNLYQNFAVILTPVLSPENAETDYTWRSEDPAIATVNYKGKVLGINEGVTNIIVTTKNGLEATCKVSVTPLPYNLDNYIIKDRISTVKSLVNKTLDNIYY